MWQRLMAITQASVGRDTLAYRPTDDRPTADRRHDKITGDAPVGAGMYFKEF